MGKRGPKPGTGGSPPGSNNGGGRPKGSPNKRTEAAIKKAQAGGTMPLQIILVVMRHWEGVYNALVAIPAKLREDTWGKQLTVAMDNMRAAAKDAAPYLHATIKAQMNVPLTDAAMLAQAKDVRSALARLVAQGREPGAPGSDPKRLN